MDDMVVKTEVALVEPNPCPLDVHLVNSKRTNKPSSALDLVDLARAVQKADDFTKANASSKLTIIVDQIRFLQNQARKVLEDARRDTALHHAACNFVKRPGSMYFLYERGSGQSYLSMVSPQEWGTSCPHTFLGAFRLEFDQSWTPISDIQRKDEDLAIVDKIYNAQLAITTGPLTADILNPKKISNSIEDSSTSS
ncbi:hypothetical protein Bpfe_013295 [Biomphalaria pfeifferi]|uniref:DUF2452 domain-containing protein n=1 Tax=Biomphalaria pfeifferi TaxID=112525 RepID=A0AAD8BNA0_BIOPF|nr:hypothetical protein Bpfe_013295 [Biomphalaria pfeifferi]